MLLCQLIRDAPRSRQSARPRRLRASTSSIWISSLTVSQPEAGYRCLDALLYLYAHVSCLVFRTFTVAFEGGHGPAPARDEMLYARTAKELQENIGWRISADY